MKRDGPIPAERVAQQMLGGCLAMRVRMMERVVTQLYNEAVAEHGVTVAQTTLLAAITANPGARATDLSAALVIDRSTLSRNLRRLHALHLIRSEPGASRSQHLFVTDAGRAVLEGVHAGWQVAQGHAAELLGEGVEALSAVADAFHERTAQDR